MRLDTAVSELLAAKGIPHPPAAAGIWSSDGEAGVLTDFVCLGLLLGPPEPAGAARGAGHATGSVSVCWSC